MGSNPIPGTEVLRSLAVLQSARRRRRSLGGVVGNSSRGWLLSALVTLMMAGVMLSCSSGDAPADAGSASESLPESLPQSLDAGAETGRAEAGGADPWEESAQIGDPDADPRTALGRLRARYFPKWSSELDWAFPPEVCETPWELDGIAAPAAHVDSQVLGDIRKAAALTVMLYERTISQALFEPSVLSQICVSTVSLPPARTANLEVLASYIDRESRRAEAPNYPGEVEIIAHAPASVLAAACVKPGYPTVLAADGGVVAEPQAPVRLQTYLLALAAGQEDEVADVTLRVSRLFHRPADGCEELVEWVYEWRLRVEAWIAEGQLWNVADAAVTEEDLCRGEHKDEDCPLNWT